MIPIKNNEPSQVAKRVEKASTTEPSHPFRPVMRAQDHEERKNKFKKALGEDKEKATEDDEVDCKDVLLQETVEKEASSLFDLACSTSKQMKTRTENRARLRALAKGKDEYMHKMTDASFEEMLKEEKEMSGFGGSQSDNSHSSFQQAYSPYTVQSAFEVTRVAQSQSLEKGHATRKIMLELAQKLCESLQIMKTDDRVETTLTLQNPPLFGGASLVITEFHTAKNEFNLTFYNLNAQARALVETRLNQDALRAELLEKGYQLHMVTIEPKLDIQVTSLQEGQGTARDGQGHEDEQNPDSRHNQNRK